MTAALYRPRFSQTRRDLSQDPGAFFRPRLIAFSRDVPETTLSARVQRLIFLDIQCLLNREHAFRHLFDFVNYSPHLRAEG